jgi:hypothetical protein
MLVFYFMEKEIYKEREGKIFLTKQGYNIKLLNYNKADDCKIVFLDNYLTVINNVQYCHILDGSIRNPYHKSIYNKGFIGVGISFKDTKKAYSYWHRLLERCYNERLKEKRPSYKTVSVCDEWHNFQNFAKWFDDNYNIEFMDGWQLDKDILIKGNKIYSPKTCCFVPSEVNTLFTKSNSIRGEFPLGVSKLKNRFYARINKGDKNIYLGSFKSTDEAFNSYKIEKEKYIKEIADKWKDKINKKVYNAMYNYKVEISD